MQIIFYFINHVRSGTLLDFNPMLETEEAGLTVFMNQEHHYDVCLSLHAGRRHVTLRRRVGDMQVIVTRREVRPGPVEIGFTADEQSYHFHYADADGRQVPLGDGRIRYLSTEVAGGFTGIMIGLYASGNGAAAITPADFDWFDYSG